MASLMYVRPLRTTKAFASWSGAVGLGVVEVAFEAVERAPLLSAEDDNRASLEDITPEWPAKALLPGDSTSPGIGC